MLYWMNVLRKLFDFALNQFLNARHYEPNHRTIIKNLLHPSFFFPAESLCPREWPVFTHFFSKRI